MQTAVDRDHLYLVWVALACCGLHMVEEYAFNFPAWATSVGMTCSATDLNIVNGGFLLFGLCAAVVGRRSPRFSLSFPALLLLNVLFHVGATIVSRRLNPGVITAVLLFLPVGIAAIRLARRDEVLDRRGIVGTFAIALAVHAYPLILLMLRPLFTY